VFSYFDRGIKNTIPNKIIDLPELVYIIKTNNRKDDVGLVRTLKSNGDNNYKRIKETLPNITPHCIVKKRCLRDVDFESNFISASGYVYIDIDNIEDAAELKRDLILEYGDKANLICLSAGGNGIAMLFRLTNTITQENFNTLRSELIHSLLSSIKVDRNSGGLGRAMFISYDPEVWYNYDNRITLSIESKEDVVKNPNSYSLYYNREDYHFLYQEKKTPSQEYPTQSRYKIYTIDVVLSKVITKTQVPVLNPIVDFKPIDYVESYIPEVIRDGSKHRTFYRLIHQWYYLNPNIELDYLYSYLFFINNTRSKPRMEVRELVRFFTAVVTQIKRSGQLYPAPSVKRVHFNPEAALTPKEKIRIAAQLNSAYIRSQNIDKITQARLEFERQGKKVTNRSVAALTNLSVKTVGKYINCTPIDMNYEVSRWN